jgi:cytochrome c oxidase subunit IV
LIDGEIMEHTTGTEITDAQVLPQAVPEVKHAKHPPYIGIWVMLAVLTAVELTVAFLPWHKRLIIALLIGLAIWKALLVALYYMHLRFETYRLRILAIAPLPLAVILVTAVITEYFW